MPSKAGPSFIKIIEYPVRTDEVILGYLL